MDDDIQTRRYWTDFGAKVTGAPILFGAATKKTKIPGKGEYCAKITNKF
jgi:hypothetical protein